MGKRTTGQINALGGHAGDIGTTTDRVFAMAEAVGWEGEKRRREKAEKEKKKKSRRWWICWWSWLLEGWFGGGGVGLGANTNTLGLALDVRQERNGVMCRAAELTPRPCRSDRGHEQELSFGL